MTRPLAERRRLVLDRMEAFIKEARANAQTGLWADPIELDAEEDRPAENALEVLLTWAFLRERIPHAASFIRVDEATWTDLSIKAASLIEQIGNGGTKHEMSVEDLIDDLLEEGVRRVLREGVAKLRPYFWRAVKDGRAQERYGRYVILGECWSPYNDIAEELNKGKTRRVDLWAPANVALTFLRDPEFIAEHTERAAAFIRAREARAGHAGPATKGAR